MSFAKPFSSPRNNSQAVYMHQIRVLTSDHLDHLGRSEQPNGSQAGTQSRPVSPWHTPPPAHSCTECTQYLQQWNVCRFLSKINGRIFYYLCCWIFHITAAVLASSHEISRHVYSVYLFRARIDGVQHPCRRL